MTSTNPESSATEPETEADTSEATMSEAAGDPTAAPAAPAASEAQAETAPAEQTQPVQSRPRTGPIIWGALILAFCVYVAQRSLAPNTLDTTTWLIAGVIGLGALLLVVGVAVLLRGARGR